VLQGWSVLHFPQERKARSASLPALRREPSGRSLALQTKPEPAAVVHYPSAEWSAPVEPERRSAPSPSRPEAKALRPSSRAVSQPWQGGDFRKGRGQVQQTLKVILRLLPKGIFAGSARHHQVAAGIEASNRLCCYAIINMSSNGN
jgi:hypothetical protein